MTSCHTSHINFSHCIADGSRRPNFLFGKMLGRSLFHILWTSRSSYSPCPYGIVVVVFHFDSGGRKAKQSKSWSELCLQHHWRRAQYFATLPQHHLLAAARAFHLKQMDILEKNIFINSRLKLFSGGLWLWPATVIPIACFSVGRRSIRC